LLTESACLHTDEQRQLLLGLAVDSIRYGLEYNRPLHLDPADCPDWLAEKRATFVTLNSAGQLRGCIGTLHAQTSLREDVARNAWAAATRDPRFSPVTAAEFPDLAIHISILGIPEKMAFASEHELINRLRCGIDGLILRDGTASGTFLPSVWESLPDPEEFLRHLKLKAGLAANHWSDSVEVYRYMTEMFGADLREILAHRKTETGDQKTDQQGCQQKGP